MVVLIWLQGTMITYGCIWLYMVFYGVIWLYMALYGFIYICKGYM